VSANRLLVRAPNWIGDAILSLPALRDLRRNFPEARLEVLARPWVADLYRAVSEVDAVRESGGFGADVKSVRGDFDTGVLLTNSFGTALQLFLARVPQRWGYASDGRGVLLTRRARVPAALRGRSQVYYYRSLLAGLGLRVSAAPDASLSCPEEWRAQAAERLGNEAATWIGLNPGAAYGTAKRWLPDRYAALGDLLRRETGASIAIIGGAAERALGDRIAEGMSSPPRVLSGETSLPELMGVLSGLRLLVTNDSGPMHLAAALGIPVVAVFGPTDWRETAPVGTSHRLVREHVECAPCGLRDCPIDHRCMRRVTLDRVLEAARELLPGAGMSMDEKPGRSNAPGSEEP
jgi:heptosyltransferase-2